MRKLLLTLLIGLSIGGEALAQTNTPTNTATNTPTNTPTQTVVPRDGKTDFAAWVHQSVRVDPASLNLGESEEVIVNVRGIQIGDPITVQIPASLEAALVFSGARVVANNRVAIRVTSLVNSTNGTGRDWRIIWFDRTQVSQTPGPAPTVTNTP
jgi:flagellar basal body L-ring protein FlgH